MTREGEGQGLPVLPGPDYQPEPASSLLLDEVQDVPRAPAAPDQGDPRASTVRDLLEPDAVQDVVAGPGSLLLGSDMLGPVSASPQKLVPEHPRKAGCHHRRGTWCTCVKTWSRP